ncbi:hypothetical protein PsorP6_003360 [Peronosclerospora sorghi]|uniref:Uncharacterized protein n=1 Tax=Peronosclerospora sorghi TaxID=230839 RepID=A0ACC0VLA4_9STRA|nr:hypothetical protein PsorP6_003360 [Peronosclerospora sorghi]
MMLMFLLLGWRRKHVGQFERSTISKDIDHCGVPPAPKLHKNADWRIKPLPLFLIPSSIACPTFIRKFGIPADGWFQHFCTCLSNRCLQVPALDKIGHEETPTVLSHEKNLMGTGNPHDRTLNLRGVLAATDSDATDYAASGTSAARSPTATGTSAARGPAGTLPTFPELNSLAGRATLLVKD